MQIKDDIITQELVTVLKNKTKDYTRRDFN